MDCDNATENLQKNVEPQTEADLSRLYYGIVSNNIRKSLTFVVVKNCQFNFIINLHKCSNLAFKLGQRNNLLVTLLVTKFKSLTIVRCSQHEQ